MPLDGEHFLRRRDGFPPWRFHEFSSANGDPSSISVIYLPAFLVGVQQVSTGDRGLPAGKGNCPFSQAFRVLACIRLPFGKGVAWALALKRLTRNRTYYLL